MYNFKLQKIRISRNEYKMLKSSEIRDHLGKIASSKTEIEIFKNRKSYRGDLNELSVQDITNFISSLSRYDNYHPIPFAGNMKNIALVIVTSSTIFFSNLVDEMIELNDKQLLDFFMNEIDRIDIKGTGGNYIFIMISDELSLKYGNQSEILELVNVGCVLQSISILAATKGYRGCIHFFMKNDITIKVDDRKWISVCFYRIGR